MQHTTFVIIKPNHKTDSEIIKTKQNKKQKTRRLWKDKTSETYKSKFWNPLTGQHKVLQNKLWQELKANKLLITYNHLAKTSQTDCFIMKL